MPCAPQAAGWAPRMRSSQPSRTATARGSWRSRWPAPASRLSSADAVGVGELPGVARRHALVVVAVHHEQRAGREPAGRSRSAGTGGTPGSTRRPTPGSPACGWRRSPGRARGTAAGCSAQSSKSARGLSSAAGPHPGVVGGDADGDRAAGVRADQHDLGRAPSRRSGSRSPCAGRRPSPAARSRPRSCRCRGS